MSGRFLTLAIATTALLGCSAEPRSGRQDAVPLAGVATEVVAEAPWAGGIEATGTLEPERRATPGTILSGRVTRIVRRVGDRVRRGETLARVQSGDIAARVASAESAVVAAEAAELNARRMRERLERLVAKQAATAKSLEDAVAGHEAAAGGLRAAEEGVRAARVMLAYGEVTSPFDGVVVRLLVEEGDVAGPGMPMFVVEDTSRMKLDAAVAESRAGALAPGDAATVMLDALPGPAREATIAEILPSNDPGSRTATVRVLLDNGDGVMRAGMFARALFPGAGPAGLAIPVGAVVRRGPLEGVFVVDESGVARLRWLTLGTTQTDRVEVLTGLAAGERIVTSPPAGLSDGRRVEGAR